MKNIFLKKNHAQNEQDSNPQTLTSYTDTQTGQV